MSVIGISEYHILLLHKLYYQDGKIVLSYDDTTKKSAHHIFVTQSVVNVVNWQHTTTPITAHVSLAVSKNENIAFFPLSHYNTRKNSSRRKYIISMVHIRNNQHEITIKTPQHIHIKMNTSRHILALVMLLSSLSLGVAFTDSHVTRLQQPRQFQNRVSHSPPIIHATPTKAS